MEQCLVGLCRLCDQEIGIHLFEDVRDPYPKGDELPRRKATCAQWMLLSTHHPLEGGLLRETKTREPDGTVTFARMSRMAAPLTEQDLYEIIRK
ncbi:hypothetical protein ASF71_20710 [Deinococcus sp. Leaf326]|nr:hypothetical protein ASF71_20710 [Deinococcus sp. Leaf326]